MRFEDAIREIRRVVPDCYFGKTLLKHLWATRGRGEYEPASGGTNTPIQFEYHDHGRGTGKFIGIASHRGKKLISFGHKWDNR
jgi:hypothetical protein